MLEHTVMKRIDFKVEENKSEETTQPVGDPDTVKTTTNESDTNP